MSSRSLPLLTNLSSCKNAPKWSMRGRSAVKEGGLGAKGPGPGSYGVTKPEKTRGPRAPAANFGTALRDPSDAALRQLPGPGQYTPATTVGKTPQFGFGTSLRGGPAGPGGNSAAQQPGPGAYDVRKDIGGRAPAFSSRYESQKGRSLTPGPGQYATNLMGDHPGPRFGFGTSERPDPSRISKGPGPGTYMQGNSIGQTSATCKSVPKYSLKPRRNQHSHDHQTPGPSLTYTQFG